MLAIIMNDNWL